MLVAISGGLAQIAWATDTASVRTFGALGDGIIDDTAAVRAAVSSLTNAGILYFPKGVYRIDSEIQLNTSIEIACDGATIRSTRAIRSYFHFSGTQDVQVHGCIFDQNKHDLPLYADESRQPQNVALFLDSSKGTFSVYDNTFADLYTNAIRLYHFEGSLDIRDNTFRSSAQSQILHLEHIYIVTAAGRIEIRNNHFLNAASSTPASVPGCIFVSGTVGSVHIEHNDFDFCGRDNTGHHRVGVIDFYGNSENVRVVGNVATNTMGQFLRLGSSWPAAIVGNTIRRNVNAERGTTISVEATDFFVGGGRVGTVDVDIRDNVLEAEGPDNIGIVVGSYDYAIPSRRVTIARNELNKFHIGVGLCGPYDDATIEDNSVRSGERSAGLVVWTVCRGVTLTSAHGVSESSGRYGNLRISGNNLEMVARNVTPIAIDLRRTPAFSGDVGSIYVARNAIEVEPGGATAAIEAHGVAATKGQLYVLENRAEGFAKIYRASDFGKVIAGGNVSH
jgi:hypothetical protein